MTKRKKMTKEEIEEIDELINSYADLPEAKQEIIKEAAIMSSPLGDTINKLQSLAEEMAKVVVKHGGSDSEPIAQNEALGIIGAMGMILIDVRQEIITDTIKYVEIVASSMFKQLMEVDVPSKKEKQNLQKAIDLLNLVPMEPSEKTPPVPPVEQEGNDTIH